MAENNNLNKLITLGNLQTFLGLIRNEYKVKDVTGSTYVSVATTSGTSKISLNETQFALATTDAHKDKKKLATDGYVDEKIATVSTNADSKISAVTATDDNKYISATAVTTANAAEVKVSAVTKAVSAATSTETGLADAYDVQQYVTSKISNNNSNLKVTGTAENGKYVSLVTQTDGLVSATYANLPVSGISTATGNVITLENGLLSTEISLQYTTGKVDGKDAKVINLVGKNGRVLSTINATEFIKDGMVSSGAVSADTDGKLNIVLQFNTDAGKQDLVIPATSLVDVYTISGSNNSGVTLYKGTAEVGTVAISKVQTAETAEKVANKLSINGVEYNGSAAVTMNKMVSGVTLTDSANTHVKLSGASVSDAGVLTIGVDETNLNTKLNAISGAISAITDGYVNSIAVSGTANGLFTLTPSEATSGAVTIKVDDTNLNNKLTAISGAISGMDATIACSTHETDGIVNVLTGLTQENGKITGSGQTAVATKGYVDSGITITGVTVNTKTVTPTNKSVALSISSDANVTSDTDAKGIVVSTSEAGAVTVKANVAAESDINALFA